MRFEYYHEGLANVPKLSVDGTVSNSIHFSHWQGNETPAAVKADTSTEIALKLVGSAHMNELTRGVELVTNNHFDTDGVLSVWTMLAGERALRLAHQLVSAAEAGDFSEFKTADGVRASIVIQGSDQPVANETILSPLADHLAGERVTDEARAYELVLPEVERVVTRTGDYEPLWRAAWTRIERALESFARGASSVEENADAKLSVITLSRDLYGAQGFNPSNDVIPFTAISHAARGQLFLIAIPAEGGWCYRIDYPYYSWAETVVRPRIERRDLRSAMIALDEAEQEGSGSWRLDTSELASAAKFMDGEGRLGVSKQTPGEVARVLEAFALTKEATEARSVVEAGNG